MSTNNRTENQFIRSLFEEHYDGPGCVRHYNDLRVNGRRRVFKIDQHWGTVTAWRQVVKALEDTVYRGRWELWISKDLRECGIRRFQER